MNTQLISGLTLGIPTYGRPVCLQWAMSFKSTVPPINYNMAVNIIRNQPVADARNAIVEQALKQGHKYVFFMGDDTISPPNTLKRLIYRMEHDSSLGVVGGVYCAKSDPPFPLVFQQFGGGSYWDWKVGDYFECVGLGMDATLIRLDVCREMEGPWFKTIDVDGFEDAKNSTEQWTEDLYFCKRVLDETEYKIYAEGSILCDHWEHSTNRFYNLPPDSRPILNAKGDSILPDTKIAIDVGCGPLKKNFNGYTVKRFDKNKDFLPDHTGDLRMMPFDDDEFDLVYSSHVLEHVPKKDTLTALKEMVRILRKEDGILFLVLPDLDWAVKKLADGDYDGDVSNVLYGSQQDPLDFHCTAFNETVLRNLLEDQGFKHIDISHRLPYNLVGIASNAEFDAKEMIKTVIGD